MSLKSETTPNNTLPVDELTYEQAFAELETIVGALEGEDQPLEEALSLYERGQTLARFCAELLDKAELKVTELTEVAPDDFQDND